MKKQLLYIISLFILFPYNSYAIVGKCLLNEDGNTTKEEEGQIVEKEKFSTSLCGCFDVANLYEPKFTIPKEDFLIKSYSYKEIYNQATGGFEASYENKISSKACDDFCSELCKQPSYNIMTDK